MSFETLDFIADAYTPILAFLAIASIVFQVSYSQRKIWVLILSAGLLIDFLIVAYGLMFLDRHFGWWHSLKLDYSTHTAVASVLVFYLAFMHTKFRNALCVSLILYFLLMLYQQYHSVLDIISTLAVILASCVGITILYQRVRSLLIK